ncbi:unnamed protein product [Paramecium sonneborni]|uniref:Uncharacterized protein n=1 Tax=Paramecium sonneborni TaxID=65129 RepID=A0A8S1LM54_9CILI|nr:unnamed protein product [Paramecium sonneborni]
MKNLLKCQDNQIFEDDEEELESEHTQKKKLQFINRLSRKNNKSFDKSWLNAITQENKIELQDQMKQAVGDSKFKFKYLFQIPQIINNPKLVQRKKTYEIFTKNSSLEQYYLQLKKASSGAAKTISSKADYKDILSQISNNKVQDNYQHQFKQNNGVIYTNELWSQKLRNQIYDQSRLKELSELLEMNKIKMSYEEQIMNFQEYFIKKLKPKKQSITEMKQIIESAFYSENLQSQKNDINKEVKQQHKSLISYFKSQNEDQTQEFSTKHSRMASRNQSQGIRPQSQEMSFLSRRASTSQQNHRMMMVPQFSTLNSPINSPVNRLESIVQDTKCENQSTKQTIKQINNFIKKENEIQEKLRDDRMKKYRVQALNNAIKLKKNRETNSHIVNRQE